MLNKKAQAGPVAIIFLLLVFVINWVIWLGPWLVDVGKISIAQGGLTGVEAFFWSNLNLIVMVALVLGTMAYFYFSGGQ